MIYTTQALYQKYDNYKAPHIKIKTEVLNQRLFMIMKGLYVDQANVDGYLLSGYIVKPSYLSFEFALAYHGLIPERVYTYTSATVLKNHNKYIETTFGNFTYTDVPVEVFMYEIQAVTEQEYTYYIASKEKALCDLLYKKKPVYSIKALKILLFEDLRIDEQEFSNLSIKTLKELCPLYKKKNLSLLLKMLGGIR